MMSPTNNVHDDSDAANMSSGKVIINPLPPPPPLPSPAHPLADVGLLAGRKAFGKKPGVRLVSREEGII